MRKDETFTFYEGACFFTQAFLGHLFSEILPNLHREVGPAAWIPQLLSGVLGFGYLGLFILLMRRHRGMDFTQICDDVYGKAISKVAQAALLCYVLLYCGTALNQGVETLQIYAYADMSALQIDLILMGAVCVFALYSIKGMAKIISVLLPFVVISIVTILALSHKQYDVNLLTPVLGYGIRPIARDTVHLASKFNGILALGVVGTVFRDHRHFAKSAMTGIVVSTTLFTAATLCYCMAIPYSSAEDMQVGLVGLAQSNYNGRFLQRLESIYIAITVMAILLLIGYSFLIAKKIYCNIFSITTKHAKAVIVPLAALVVCIARTIGNDQNIKQSIRYLSRRRSVYFCIGLILLTLIVSLIRRRGKGKGPRLAKTTAMLLIPCLLVAPLSGCGNYQEPDSEIFPIVLGYDKGEKEKYRITFKFMTETASPKGQDAESGGGENPNEVPQDVMVCEAPSFTEGLHLINSLMPRDVSLLHIKMLVVSEEIAHQGVSEIVAPLIRYNEIKPTMAFVVCRGSAYDLISSKNPTLTAPVQSDIELMMNTAKENTSYRSISLSQFLYGYKSTYGDAMAIYSALNQSGYKKKPGEEGKEQEQTPPGRRLADTPSTAAEGYLPGELPVAGNRQLEMAGMAVFRGDKMVGTLNTRESQTLTFLEDNFRTTMVAFPDMLEPEEYFFTLSIRRVQPVEVETSIDGDGKAHIEIKVRVNGLLGVSQNPNVNYLDDADKREEINVYTGKIMQQRSMELIEKLQKECEADILQLGRRVARNFRTIKEWEDYNWLEKFKDADIRVDFQIYL